jgi:hypothetical protein
MPNYKWMIRDGANVETPQMLNADFAMRKEGYYILREGQGIAHPAWG